ncbi:hypothetical protein DICPUDRAFT_80479 [Dictyostelium purpureum]|uniref:Elongation factor Ts, mitochondrial n=1 Tax=Dictyostelium purpureum TaxID=5786 RepID=F0ZQL3_DICPU|nr:uncharacterized protein DICPUDRAFT_80479 [Dictyostelium purpureum]EGC33786.1 hypothetical protein DICPUDRAFT_80479 [Dictyostelium purpureum]|eukprot:XP_003289711.1 hypothetical protein DICPUDRAFT_80479 [Dictyostelium purpureum]
MIRSSINLLRASNKINLNNTNRLFANSLLLNNGEKKSYFSTEVKVPIELIKELRVKTQSPVQECKKALQASNNDIEKAVQWLLEKGKATAEKLKTRVSAEGIVSILTSGNKGVILEMNSETDFVSRGDIFRDLAQQISKASLENSSAIVDGKNGVTDIAPTEVDKINPIKFDFVIEDTVEPMTVRDLIVRAVSKLRENIVLRRVSLVSSNSNNVVVSGYAHNPALADSTFGRLGAIVELEYEGECNDINALKDFGKKIATHIVAQSPSCVSVDDIAADIIEDCKKNNKSVEKLYDDMVLLEQELLGSLSNEKVKDSLVTLSNKLGSKSISIKSFRRYAIGETADKL